MTRECILLMLFGLTILGSLQSRGFTCEYYLANSKIIGAGKGVFCNQSIKNRQMLDESPAIFIKYEHIYKCDLQDYIFASTDDDYGVTLLGLTSMFNHDFNESIEYYAKGKYDDDVKSHMEGYTANSVVTLGAVRDIDKDEELYINYGDEWFSARIDPDKLPPQDSPADTCDNGVCEVSGTTNETHEVGRKVCISTVGIGESSRYAANNGAFAKRSFQSGKLITVSPALVLPWDLVEETKDSSLLINFCLHEPNSDVALLPLGHTAMINHYRSLALVWKTFDEITGDELLEPTERILMRLDYAGPNVEIRWFDWDFFQSCEASRSDEDCLSDARINESPMSRRGEDASGSKSVVLAYYATSSIEAGSELLLNYGESWERAYEKHLRLVEEKKSTKSTGDDVDDAVVGVFREAIELPLGFMA